MTQDEHLTYARAHLFQGTGNVFKGIYRRQQLFGGWGLVEVLDVPGKFFTVSLFELLPTAAVDQQPSRHRGQKRPRLARRHVGTRTEQAHEGVLRQVGGIVRTVQASPQPPQQPAVIALVQGVETVSRRRHVHWRRH
ncbi:hypothetical protein D3C76_1154780 [compost metagenome]